MSQSAPRLHIPPFLKLYFDSSFLHLDEIFYHLHLTIKFTTCLFWFIRSLQAAVFDRHDYAMVVLCHTLQSRFWKVHEPPKVGCWPSSVFILNTQRKASGSDARYACLLSKFVNIHIMFKIYQQFVVEAKQKINIIFRIFIVYFCGHS